MDVLGTIALFVVGFILIRELFYSRRHNAMLKEMNKSNGLIWYDKCVGDKIFTYYAPTRVRCQKFDDKDRNGIIYYYFIDYNGNLLGGQYAWGDKRELSPTEIRQLKIEMNRKFDY